MPAPFANIAHAHAVLPEAALRAAVNVLQQGGLVAFPTETVYGLGADAENVAALRKLYAVKGRPGDHPVIVHLAHASQLAGWAVDIPAEAWQLARAFWPGPLTLILKRASRVPDTVTGGQDTVGLRVPGHPMALQLLEAFGGGIAGPSANRFGRLSPTCSGHVRADLGDDVDCVLDGGPCAVGVESTIVAFQNGKPVVLRPGMITVAQIEAALSGEAMRDAAGSAPAPRSETVSRAPGTLASHYAPRTPLTLMDGAHLLDAVAARLQAGHTLGVLAWQASPFEQAALRWIDAPFGAERYAQQLYTHLRALDSQNLTEILVETPPMEPAWAAIHDRLRRAAYRADG